jgi:hypothetical protein
LIYRQLYLSNHNNFAFAGDVARTKQAANNAVAEKEKARLDHVLSALGELEKQITAGSAHVDIDQNHSDVFVDTEGYRWSFLFDSAWSGDVMHTPKIGGRIYLSDRSNRQIASEPMEVIGPDLALKRTLSEKQWNDLTDSYFPPDIRDRVKREQATMILRNDTYRDLAELQDVASADQWSYLDFFYFSTITQTTVGYGDILPNSSAVRIVVIMQALIGIFSIGVGVGLLTMGNDEMAAPLNAK